MPVTNLLPNEIITIASIWGGITGDISDQSDLTDALDGKSGTEHDHDSDYEPKNSNIQEHISSADNPHSVSKSQIGLGNVTDDAQLKVSDFSEKGVLIAGTGESEYAALVSGSQGDLLTVDDTGSSGLAWTNIFDINTETLTGDKTLTASDKLNQIFDPGGANRNVYLSTTDIKLGKSFRIMNSISHTVSYYLNIKQGSTIIDVVWSGSQKEYFWNGSNWYPASTGSGSSSIHGNTLTGQKAAGRYYATACGYQANADDVGTAIGASSDGSTSGAAVGYSAYAKNSGAALGRDASTNNKVLAVALGRSSKCERYGEVVKSAEISSSPKFLKSEAQWFGTTTDDTETEILLDGLTQRYVMIAQSSISFEILIIARNNAGNVSKGWTVAGVIHRDNSNITSLVGSISKSVISESGTYSTYDTNNWDVDAEADDTNESLIVKVTGEAGITIRWEAAGSMAEVRF